MTEKAPERPALEAAQARIAELEAENREAAMQYLADAGQLTERVAELEAALDAPNRHAYKVGVAVGKATARREALEEAAKVATGHLDRLPNYRRYAENTLADKVEEGY